MNIKKILKKFNFLLRITPSPDLARERWVMCQCKKLKKGRSIIDVGAGEMPYRDSCSHLKYTSQDFGEYNGKNVKKGIQTGYFNAKKVDIISDIIDIPVKKGSFDYILCTDVFEHISNPIAALKEMSRIHKIDGLLILTAPFASLTHFYPYHFYSGFSKEFYKVNLPKFGYKILDIQTSGNYFSWLSVELLRIPIVIFSFNILLGLLLIPVFILAIPFLIFIRICGLLFTNSADLLYSTTFVLAKKVKNSSSN